MVARMNCDEIGHKLQVRFAIKTVRSKYCGVWSEIWVVSLIFDYVFFYLFNWLLEVVDIMSLLFLMWFRDLSMMFWKDNNKLSSLMIPKFVLQFLWKWIEHSSHAKLNLISLLKGAIWYTLVLKDAASTKNLGMRL